MVLFFFLQCIKQFTSLSNPAVSVSQTVKSAVNMHPNNSVISHFETFLLQQLFCSVTKGILRLSAISKFLLGTFYPVAINWHQTQLLQSPANDFFQNYAIRY
jgi:hypothetical protein